MVVFMVRSFIECRFLGIRFCQKIKLVCQY